MSVLSFGRHLVTLSKKNFAECSTRSFEFKIRGQIFQGFIVRKNGKFFAYQNICQHLPITLDLNDNLFLDHDRKYLQCHMHGAMYEMESGLCIAGPCQGARLVSLELEEEETRIVVKIPENFGQK